MTKYIEIPLAVAVVFLISHTGAAYGAVGDPPVGSPSGAVYELPFESGRVEAAPKGSGGTGAPGEAGPRGGDSNTGGNESSEGSLYRSENNFGSSSKVPGTEAASGQTDAAGGAGAGNGAGSGSGNGTDARTEGGNNMGAFVGSNASKVTDSGNTSAPSNIALLALIGAIAGCVAFFAVRARRFRAQS